MKLLVISILFIISSGISRASVKKDQFFKVIEQVRSEFYWDVKAAGREFVNKAVLTISGAYVRKKLMTEDALRIVLCHELGHLLAGAPTKDRYGWGSLEG